MSGNQWGWSGGGGAPRYPQGSSSAGIYYDQYGRPRQVPTHQTSAPQGAPPAPHQPRSMVVPPLSFEHGARARRESISSAPVQMPPPVGYPTAFQGASPSVGTGSQQWIPQPSGVTPGVAPQGLPYETGFPMSYPPSSSGVAPFPGAGGMGGLVAGPSTVGPPLPAQRPRTRPWRDGAPVTARHEEGMHGTQRVVDGVAFREYPCPEPMCFKTFTRPSKLQQHIRTHTGERPFTCEVPGCGQTFTTRSNLQRHHRRHGISTSGSAEADDDEV